MFKSFLGIHEKSAENSLKTNLLSFSGVPMKNIKFKEISTVREGEYLHIVEIDNSSIENKVNTSN